MTEQPKPSTSSPTANKSRVRYLIPLVLLFVVPVLGYLAYDLLKPLVNPCEALFRQTQNSLSAKIKVLRIESEVNIAPQQMQELSERAQIVASNLQYCCTTLRGGQRQPEDFISCKTASIQFESGLDKLLQLSTEQSQATEAQAEPSQAISQQISQTLNQTKQVSVNFNQQITKLQSTEQFSRLAQAENTDRPIQGVEAEPNDSLLMPNKIPLESWVRGGLQQASEVDFYSFVSPPTYRDYLHIEIQNQSMTLSPQILVYTEQRAIIHDLYNGTNGGNISYEMLAAPDHNYSLRIGELRQAQVGEYLLRVTPLKRYDAYEPNDSPLTAVDIDISQITVANIMDGADQDYFRFTASQEGELHIRFENLSATISPQMLLYDQNKSRLKEAYDGTSGSNLLLSHPVQANQAYYLRVKELRDGQRGDYSLSFAYQE